MRTNNRYEVLTPDGFKDFIGVQKTKKKTIELFFDNGISIRGSLNHQIYDYDENPFILSEINIGDKIKSDDGFITVTNIKKRYNKTNVYDLIEVDGGNVYYTNNILSHNCAFNGSGDNVIESAVLDKQLATNIIAPIIKDKRWDSLLWIWKLPEANHRYIAALDVSRGDSEDSTGFTIIDFDTFEQVLEFHGKVPPDLAAQIVDQYSRMYNALTTFDITGGMGIAATNKLKELNFPGKLYHYDDDDDLTLFYGADNDKIPGINFAKQNRRVQIVEALERAISREGFKMRSVRLHNELKKFVYKNGKPDHMKGSHDDLIMALGMCLFVANNSFRKLSESVNSTKAMIDSWKVNTNNIQTTSNTMLQEATKLVTENNYGQNNDIYGNNNDTMKNTLEFSWLFGNIKKK